MNDHDARMLDAWFDANEVGGSPPALERALAAVKGKPQRPGWLVSARGGTIAGDDLRGRFLPIPLLAALVLMALFAIVVAFAAGGLNLLTVLPSASPLGPTVEPIPTKAPTAGPIIAGTCGTGRTVITAAPAGAPVPEVAKAIRAPEGGRLAIAIEDQPTPLDPSATITSGSIVVAGPDAESVRVIATFTGQGIRPSDGVGIVAWSASGDSLLVYAGSHSTLTPDRSCGNLWIVQADGSTATRLTDNGPGWIIYQTAFSPSSTSVAYFQEDVLHILDLAGGEEAIPIGDCPPHQLHWSPDERQILLVCGTLVMIVDRDLGRATRLQGRGSIILDAVWSADRRSILVATEDGRRAGQIVILDLDPATGSTVTRSVSDHSGMWLGQGQTLSPDGRWLLIRGDVNTDSGDPTYRIDTTTGESTKLPWPVVGDSWFWNSHGGIPAVTWLEGNDRVLAVDGEKLYEVDLRQITRSEVGSIVPNQDGAVFMIPR